MQKLEKGFWRGVPSGFGCEMCPLNLFLVIEDALGMKYGHVCDLSALTIHRTDIFTVFIIINEPRSEEKNTQEKLLMNSMLSLIFSSTYTFGCLLLIGKNFQVGSFSVMPKPTPARSTCTSIHTCICTSQSQLTTVSKKGLLTKLHSQQEGNYGDESEIEAYVGPMRSLADMEGGIAVAESALHVLAGPSLVAPGRGLFLSIYNEYEGEDEDQGDNESIVEEVVIPQGTPLCGYARGYFSSEEAGDKSVSFMFSTDALVFFQKQLMGIGDAIAAAAAGSNSNDNGNGGVARGPKDLLWGHIVEFDEKSGRLLSIVPDKDFDARIFIPDREDSENEFAATCLGIYANDLAYDADNENEERYFEISDQNNILQLIWRLAKNEQTGMLIPTWPVVIARKDFRLVNTVPMEVGLQYGFQYWNSFQGNK